MSGNLDGAIRSRTSRRQVADAHERDTYVDAIGQGHPAHGRAAARRPDRLGRRARGDLRRRAARRFAPHRCAGRADRPLPGVLATSLSWSSAAGARRTHDDHPHYVDALRADADRRRAARGRAHFGLLARARGVGGDDVGHHHLDRHTATSTRLTSSKARRQICEHRRHHAGHPAGGRARPRLRRSWSSAWSRSCSRVINLFPFLPLDGGHVALVARREGPRPRVSLTTMWRFSSVGSCCWLPGRSTGISNDISRLGWAGRRTLTQLFVSGPEALALGRAEQRLELARRAASRLPAPGRAEPPVAPAQPRGSQCAPGSSECGSIGNERAGVCTYQPRATRRSSAANAARRAGATCSITLLQYTRSNSPSANGRPCGGVGDARTGPDRRGAPRGPRR